MWNFICRIVLGVPYFEDIIYLWVDNKGKNSDYWVTAGLEPVRQCVNK